jgi:hypothetical protein
MKSTTLVQEKSQIRKFAPKWFAHDGHGGIG